MYGGYYGNMPSSPYPQPVLQSMQGRLGQMEQQYGMYNQNNNGYQNQGNVQQVQVLKGRPVSSYDEAKASMIDLDGSLFVFTDIANKRIYTKQIQLDGTADFKTYVLEQVTPEQRTANVDSSAFVPRTEFEEAMELVSKKFESLKGKGGRDVTADVK